MTKRPMTSARSGDLPHMDCDREPIHTPGAIQPHGCMLICALPEWTVVSASGNSDSFFGRPPAKLRGRAISELLPSETVHRLRNLLQHSSVMRSVERVSGLQSCAGGLLDAAVHLQGEAVILEFERHPQRPSSGGDPISLVKGMLTRLQQVDALDDLYQQATQQFRAMTGFDRVMIYKFLQDGSGTVIAETLRAGMPPYLGLHYPATDIPRQARELYKRNWLRQIPDVNYVPVPLEPAADADGRPFDLSLSTLRSVSPVHVEYLQNMGVGASLSVSIIVGGELWGLISCHHSEPRPLRQNLHSAAELFGQMFSLLVENRQRSEEQQYEAKARAAHDRLVSSMDPEDGLFEKLEKYRPLLEELVAADGIAVWSDGRFSGVGTTPPAEAVPDLIDFLNTTSSARTFATDELAAHLPQAAAYADDVSGILAVPISKVPRDYVIFCRREVVQSITWAGDPRKQSNSTAGELRLSPRKSFEAWRETVRGRSAAWTAAEQRVIEGLRVALLEVMLRRTDMAEKERREAQERQQFLIAEMNHRVKNTLALVRSLVRKSRAAANSLDDFTENLEQRIRALSSAHDLLTHQDWKPAPLHALLEAELDPHLRDGESQIRLDGPPVLLDPRAHTAMALVLHELATNAAKYGALKDPQGRLAITWSLEPGGDFSLDWQEAGGPPVQPPRRHGFGTTVIERAIPYELGGDVDIDYAPQGLRARLTLPGEFITTGETPAASSPRPSRRRALPPHLKVLVVEDNMILALDVEEMLLRSGAERVEVVSTVDEALQLLEDSRLDVALLDLKLGRGDSLPVARRLEDLGIPFVFATGYGERAVIPPRFADIPVAGKPYSETLLARMLGEVLS